MHFIRWMVSRLVYHGEGSLCWCHTRPQPAARLRCCNVLATGRTISARKAHLRMTLEGGVRRGVGPRLLVLMVRLLTEREYRALSRWECYARCSRSLSLCFVVPAHATAFALPTTSKILRPSEIPIQRIQEKRVLLNFRALTRT